MIDGTPRRPCGTHAGFQWHNSHKQEPCAACSEAEKRWGRLYRAQKKMDRHREAGASVDQLRALGEELVQLELAYRSLEQLTDTPPPPSHRYSVYRFMFETGHGYVGMTERSVAAREAEHVSRHERLRGGSKRISALVAAGIEYELEIIKSGLTEGRARALESEERARLDKPLNIQGPGKRQPVDAWLADVVESLKPLDIDDATAAAVMEAVRDEMKRGR